MTTPFSLSKWLIVLAVVSCLFSAPSRVQAQPYGAQGDDFLYRPLAGDTLIDIAQRYTGNASNWSFLQRLNNVDEPTRLQIGRTLRIPFSMIPVRPAQATVRHVQGQVTANEAPLAMNMQLGDDTLVESGPNGFATLELADGSALTILPGSAVNIKRLRVFEGEGLTDSTMNVQSGTVESLVAPNHTGVGRFEIQTPVSITGVRGTTLRIHAQQDGSQSEVLQGSAHLGTTQGRQTTLRAGQGAATDASGKLLAVETLLPAPSLPEPVRGPSGWALSFPAVPGAASYLVRVAGDADGTRLFSSQTFPTSDIHFHSPGAGAYFVIVRAIAASGIMGRDAVQPFDGLAVLQSADGLPIGTGFGLQVTLTDY